jgi:hypothetical protein
MTEGFFQSRCCDLLLRDYRIISNFLDIIRYLDHYVEIQGNETRDILSILTILASPRLSGPHLLTPDMPLNATPREGYQNWRRRGAKNAVIQDSVTLRLVLSVLLVFFDTTV